MGEDQKTQAEDDHSEDELELSDEAAGQVRGGVSLSFQKVQVEYKPQKADG